MDVHLINISSISAQYQLNTSTDKSPPLSPPTYDKPILIKAYTDRFGVRHGSRGGLATVAKLKVRHRGEREDTPCAV